jgi:predicted ATPase with chaperone activity
VVTSHAFSAGLPARLGTGQTSTQAAVDVLPAHAADVVPINEGQRAAVEALLGGLNIIHGPPGTGKSTTIFHMIESRVHAAAHVSGRVGGGPNT